VVMMVVVVMVFLELLVLGVCGCGV
jgi:hypothetical protein